MYVVVTDKFNRLIAYINTDGGEDILVNGAKRFLAPEEENVTFIESEQGILCYPQIIIESEK